MNRREFSLLTKQDISEFFTKLSHNLNRKTCESQPASAFQMASWLLHNHLISREAILCE